MTTTKINLAKDVVIWLNRNGYIAYPKEVLIRGKLPDNFPIDIHMENGVKIAVLRFDEAGHWILEGWLNNENSRRLAEKIKSGFDIKIIPG